MIQSSQQPMEVNNSIILTSLKSKTERLSNNLPCSSEWWNRNVKPDNMASESKFLTHLLLTFQRANRFFKPKNPEST